MNRAFIFDMDGVLVDSERAWKEVERGEGRFLEKLFGTEIADKIGDTTGLSINSVYDEAVKYGSKIEKEEYTRRYDEQAARIYSRAKITEGIDRLIKRLLELGFKLGLVSSSRKSWIGQVLPKIPYKEKFDFILSINDTPDIKPKPNPDAYLFVMNKLEASPSSTVILEDSNSGIESAKATGALTIGFRKNLVPGYEQKGADVWADDSDDVIKIAESFR